MPYMKASITRLAVPALLLSALVLVPFFGKAFTIDDTVFLFEARHALMDPLHPTAFEMTWEHSPERVSHLVPTGPVMAWLLIPSIVTGGSERAAHVVQLTMLWLAILATVSLARRLGLSDLWASASGVILVAMPAVLGMAGTAMPDVPAMAFGVAGLERLAAWRQDRRVCQAVLAAVLLGLASLARSHLILLLGVGALFLSDTKSSRCSWRDRLQISTPLSAALLFIVAIAYLTRDPLPGAGTMVGAAIHYSSGTISRLASNVVAFPIHWVLAMAFAFPWMALRWRIMVQSRATVLVAFVSFLLSMVALAYSGHQSLYLAIIAGLGVAVLWDAITIGWKENNLDHLALGLWLLIGLAAAPYVNLPPKFLVVSAPAAAILVAREMELHSGKVPWIILGTAVALGLGLGLAILRADAAFADVGRRAAAELIVPRVSAGQRVWFVGRWGFQWYAEKAGARPATLTPPFPSSGDAVAVSVASARSEEVLSMIGSRCAQLTQVAYLEDASPGGRLMNKRLGAGFYSNASGYLPWVWGDSIIDAIVVWQIE